MSRPIVDDPNTLANVVTALGGTVIPGRTFRFDLPKSEVKEVIPRLNELGVSARTVGERIEDDPVRLNRLRGVVTIELYKQPDDEKFSLPNW